MPRPKLIVFAAFQFDPEAAKDIDETNWPGVTLLKAQMNADLLTDDLKKKRASNESFWLIGQPEVVVQSEEWLVVSGKQKKEVLAAYEIIAILSRLDSLTEINKLDRNDLSLVIAIAQRRDLWDALTDDKGSTLNSIQHSRRSGASQHGGVSTLSGHSSGLPGRIGDIADFSRAFKLLSEGERRKRLEGLRRDKQTIERARKIAASLTHHSPQTTTHYLSRVSTGGLPSRSWMTGASRA